MIEYPTLSGPSKAPRQECIAFEKIDGSNIRVKYNHKNGFTLFGSRHELFNETHPHFHAVIPYFHQNYTPQLTKFFKKEFPNIKEIIVFGEFFGPNSFAGLHVPEDPKEFVMFDVLLVYKKNFNEFINPKEFVKMFDGLVKIPKVLYCGNLNEQFIEDVRNGVYTNGEGVICKGIQKSGAYRGKIWMCKIKTNAYLMKLKERFGPNDWRDYWE